MASHLRNLFEPSSSLSYDFLCGVYALLALVSALFYAMEARGVEGAKGYWMITAPCAPGLLYFLFLRHRARAAGIVAQSAAAAPSARHGKSE